MDKNTIIGLLLIFALFVGYSIYMSPSKEQQKEQKRIADSILVAQQTERLADSIATLEYEKQQKFSSSSDSATLIDDENTLYEKQKAVYGCFALAAQERETKNIVVQNDKYILNINPKGAQIESVVIKNVQTYDSLPVVLFEKGNNNNVFGFTFFSNYLGINTYDLYFESMLAAIDTIKISKNDSVVLPFRVYPSISATEKDSTAYLEFVYTIHGNDYRTNLHVNFVNTGKYITQNSQVDLLWNIQLKQQEKNRKSEMLATNVYFSDVEDVEQLKESDSKGDSTYSTTSLKWISFKQLFFSATMIAQDKFITAAMISEIPEKGDERTLKNLRTHASINIDEKQSDFGVDFYFGPNKYRILKAYDLKMEKQIQLGGRLVSWINRWVIIPIFNFLEGFGWNYGLIILILTIIIKTILFPVTYKNYLSSAKMRVMKPEIDAISNRYPDQSDAMKKQQAIMSFYKSTGIKPMAGCLPMLIQFPILIAMFRFFPSAYELRQQSFLWADDLSTYDAIVSWNTHIPIISSFYGNHISLFTLLMTIATLGYTILNNKMMAPSGNAQQMKMMKWMMYLMPIMFLGVFNNYSSGLSYYYLLVNLITFVQMFIFRLCINEDKLRQKLLLKAQTPVKEKNRTSKWQKRMNDLLKEEEKRRKQQQNKSIPSSKKR